MLQSIIHYISMNFPQHLQLSLDTVFSHFRHQDAQILTRQDIIALLSFVFKQFGVFRPVEQCDIDQFLKLFHLQNQIQIAREHFGDMKFIGFNRGHDENLKKTDFQELKIPVLPFVQELKSTGCQIIQRQKIRQFLVSVNTVLQIPNPVQDGDIQKFISSFDRNGDGILQTQDLQGIQNLIFKIKKCRRYE